MYDRLLLYFRLARLTPYFSAYFIRDCRYAMSCVILLLMKDMAPLFVKLVCGNSTITDEALSFFLFYSTVQYVLYSYRGYIGEVTGGLVKWLKNMV